MLGRPPSPLSPHPFVEIGLHVLSHYASSHFLTQFQIVPTRLYFLCVNSSPWVHEIATMHHNLVCANVVYLPIDVSVSCPVVSVDFRSGSDASFYNGVKGGHIPSTDYLKTIRPFVLKGHGSIAHWASPHGLLTCNPFGLWV